MARATHFLCVSRAGLFDPDFDPGALGTGGLVLELTALVASHEMQIRKPGASTVAGVVGIRRNGDQHGLRLCAAEGCDGVILQVHALAHPLPGLVIATALNDHLRTIGVRVRPAGTDRVTIVPNIIDRPIGHTIAIKCTRQS